MSFDTWTNLKSEVAGFLNRTDLTTPIESFIALAEAEMKRRVRRSTASTTIYISAGNMNGPTDMAAPISLHLDSSSPSLDRPLRLCTPHMLAERRARANDVAGRPDSFGFWDSQLQFAPTPDQSYDGILVYYKQFTSLGASVATNTILAEAPDAYLYGALLQASIYLEHDERIPVWQERFDAAIEQLKKVRDEESYGGGLHEARLPIIFG